MKQKAKIVFTIASALLLLQGCGITASNSDDQQNGQGSSFIDTRKSIIPIDTNIDFGIEPGILYYADPRIEENGLNRALRINTQTMQFDEVAVNGNNPHSIDRAGSTNRFYMRTQNSYSFDVVSFIGGTTSTILLGDASRGVAKHKPRAIGGYNRKYNLQLLSAKDMPIVDVIDVGTDTILATLGDQNNNYTVGSNAGEDGTGHALWFDEDHFGLLDRVYNRICLYRVSRDADNTLSFTHTQDFQTRMPIHAVERVENAPTKEDSLAYYAMVDGDVARGIAPGVLEMSFDPTSGELIGGREVVFGDSVQSVSGIKPTAHHSGISVDGKYIIVPILTGKVYFVNRSSMAVEKVLEAKLGAAHVNTSKEANIIVITNHFSRYLTLINAQTLTVVKHLDIGEYQFDPNDKHLLQPHFSYIGPQGRYYYTFATQDGDFHKIDLSILEVDYTLHTGGAPEQSHS